MAIVWDDWSQRIRLGWDVVQSQRVVVTGASLPARRLVAVETLLAAAAPRGPAPAVLAATCEAALADGAQADGALAALAARLIGHHLKAFP